MSTHYPLVLWGVIAVLGVATLLTIACAGAILLSGRRGIMPPMTIIARDNTDQVLRLYRLAGSQLTPLTAAQLPEGVAIGSHLLAWDKVQGRVAFTVDATTYDDDLAIYDPNTQTFMFYNHALPVMGDLTWSADGERLTYMAPGDGSTQIFTFSPMTDRAPLSLAYGTAYERFYNGPVWSPLIASSQLAFIAQDDDALPAIWVADVSAPDAQPLRIYPDANSFILAQPAWSPDATQLVYTTANIQGGTGLNYHLYVTAADGNGTHRRITTTQDNPVQGTMAAWSPAGDKIAFVGFPPFSRVYYPYVVDVDGGAPTRLLTPRLTDVDTPLYWSPFGEHIAYINGCALYIYDIARQITVDVMRGSPMPCVTGLAW